MATQRRRARPITVAVIVAIGLVALLALVRFAALSVFATEGDMPSADAVRLPAGSTVVDEQQECASGGCWTKLSVLPADGTTPEGLVTSLGIDVIRADDWSRPAAP